MTKYDLLIKGGYLVDSASRREGSYDLGLCDGKVVDVAPEINPDHAADVFDAGGKLVFPGLVDTHVHLTNTKQAVGFQMLARAGVTCALECGGFVEDVIKGMSANGSGISIAVLNRLDPGVSISGPDAARSELTQYLHQSLEHRQGAPRGGIFCVTSETGSPVSTSATHGGTSGSNGDGSQVHCRVGKHAVCPAPAGGRRTAASWTASAPLADQGTGRTA